MERTDRGRGRGGRGRGSQQEPQARGSNRSSNWTLPETLKLLSATRETQVKVNRSDLKFTPSEWLQVLASFHLTGDFAHRKVETIKNRLKVLRQKFTMIKELLDRSGWSWDPDKNSVIAPTLDAWDDIFKEDSKWKKMPQKAFPWYEQFLDLIGSSSTTGEFGQCFVIGQMSGEGSSDGAQEYDEVPQDSDERGRFDFQQVRAVMDEDSVQQPVPIGYIPLAPSPATTETGGTSSTRSQGSNKRKSSDTSEQGRSQRVKKGISMSQQNQQDMLLEVRHIAQNSSRLAAVGEEYIGLQRKKTEVPPEVMAALGELVLNGEDLAMAMRSLHKPIEQQIFMFGGQEHKIAYLNKLIPGFMARNFQVGGQGSNYNPFGPNPAPFGGPPF